MPDELEVALGKRFIERRDIKAIQHNNGVYTPDRTQQGVNIGWKMQDLRDHVKGVKTFGHYMVSPEGMVKLFAFDLDLSKEGYWIDLRDGESFVEGAQACNPREVWLDREHPGREFLTIQLRCAAESIGMKAKTLFEDDVHIAISYSGGKGLHVYGFFNEAIPAGEARKLAAQVLKSMNEPDGRPTWKRIRGENFWGSANGERRNIEIEVFPKQDDLDGKDLGNLMRLPLGINRKTGQRSFFIDCRCGYNELRQMDALEALSGELPWD